MSTRRHDVGPSRMAAFRRLGLPLAVMLLAAVWTLTVVSGAPQTAAPAAATRAHPDGANLRAMLDGYCVSCHNSRGSVPAAVATGVEAARLVCEARHDTVFLLAGSGPLLEELRTRVSSLGMGDRIKILGWRNDIQDLVKLGLLGQERL